MGVTYNYFRSVGVFVRLKDKRLVLFEPKCYLLIFLGLGAKPKELSLRIDRWIYKKTFFV